MPARPESNVDGPRLRKDGIRTRAPADNMGSGALVDDAAAGSKKPLLVVKVGTSTMMQTQNRNFCLSNLGKFVDAVCRMKADGYQVVLVCSGSVGAGCIHLKLKERPVKLETKQAASAVGQCRMMRLYEDLFAIREQKVAQIIMTRPDLMDRTRFINFKNALKELLRLDVLPIINENDSIATAHLRFGDNDTLAAYVAVSLKAQWLFLLTDVDCLYTQNPRLHPDAKPILYVGHLDDVYALLDESENTGTAWGTGGMRTKIIAAKIATATGIPTALCHGEHPERVLDVIRFAEAHARTSSMWSQFLKTLVEEKKSAAMVGGRELALSNGPPLVHGLYETTGLAHQHRTCNTPGHCNSSPAVVSEEVVASSDDCNGIHQPESGTRATAIARTVQDNGTDDDDMPAMVTAQSLASMPYLATIFGAQECTQSIRDQRRWILSLPVRGRIYIDDGAAKAVVEGRKSLFAAGITGVEGAFLEGEAVIISRDRCPRRPLRHHGRPGLGHTASPPLPPHAVGAVYDEAELARCLVNFSSDELDQIKGLKSEMFKSVLGYECDAEVGHRDNIIFINPCSVYGCAHVAVPHAHPLGSSP